MARILLAADPHLAWALRAYWHEIDIAADQATALTMTSDRPPDLIIVDTDLPAMNGIGLLCALRDHSTVPVIVVSANGAEDDKVTALDAGADDYLTRPFGMNELAARIRAALRRSPPVETTPPIVHTRSFTIDLAAKRVTVAGTPTRLTPREWQILEALARHPGTLITQQQLLDQIWGPAQTGHANYLRVYLHALRNKLEPDPTRPRHLITEPGIGYRLET